MHKIRFNLAAGENFMKWQIRYPDGAVEHYNPDAVTIYMYNCKLRNQKGTAAKIHAGAHKSVCAWVEAEDVTVVVIPIKTAMGAPVHYNPRIAPNWVLEDENVDGTQHEVLFTSIRKIIK